MIYKFEMDQVVLGLTNERMYKLLMVAKALGVPISDMRQDFLNKYKKIPTSDVHYLTWNGKVSSSSKGVEELTEIEFFLRILAQAEIEIIGALDDDKMNMIAKGIIDHELVPGAKVTNKWQGQFVISRSWTVMERSGAYYDNRSSNAGAWLHYDGVYSSKEMTHEVVTNVNDIVEVISGWNGLNVGDVIRICAVHNDGSMNASDHDSINKFQYNSRAFPSHIIIGHYNTTGELKVGDIAIAKDVDDLSGRIMAGDVIRMNRVSPGTTGANGDHDVIIINGARKGMTLFGLWAKRFEKIADGRPSITYTGRQSGTQQHVSASEQPIHAASQQVARAGSGRATTRSNGRRQSSIGKRHQGHAARTFQAKAISTRYTRRKPIVGTKRTER